MRPTGIDVLGDVPWGTHFCQFYHTTQDLIEVLVPYFEAGLKNNEFCMWVTSDPLSADQAKAALNEKLPDLDGYLRRGQIEILDYRQWYVVDGAFNAERVLRGWVDKLAAAKARGYDGIRLTGNTFWLEKPDWDTFTAYEAEIDAVIGQHTMLALCTYSLERCGAVEIMDVVANHAFALIKQTGRWQIVEGSSGRRIEALLRENEARRLRIEEQSARIRAANTRQGLLSEVLSHLLTTDDPQGIVNELAHKVMRELDCHVFFNYLVDPHQDRLRLNAYGGIEDETARSIEYLDYGVAVCGCAARDGCRIVAENIPESTDRRTGLVRSFGVRAYACHPLMAGNQVIGTLSFGSRTRDSFSEADLAFMQAVSAHISIAMERVRAQRALRDSERLYRAIGESLDFGVWVCAPDGRNLYVSESFLKMTGITQQQCSGFGWGDVLHPEDAERTVAAWKECVRTVGTWDIEHRYRGADGQWHPVLARGVPVRDEQGAIIYWAGINLDVSALKHSEEAARQSESRERARAAELQAVMDAAPAVILIAHDAEGGPLTGNRMAYELLRSHRGSDLSTAAAQDDSAPAFRLMRDGVEISRSELPPQIAARTGKPIKGSHFEVVFSDGATLQFEGDAIPLLREDGRSRGAVGVFLDVTERKRVEAHLEAAQKLESLGLLAGGVAHDFNNLLVGVIGNASMAQDMLSGDHPVSELLGDVVKASEQAAHLTRQMLAYSGKGKFLIERLNLSALIGDMVGLVKPSIGKNIDLRLEFFEELPFIEADRGQIQQVFMNLALNAAEAVGAEKGQITIRTGVQDVDGLYKRRHAEAAELKPGRYVFLEVRDTGCGMDERVKARIFDPFFSTKFTGRGLGLAAVAGIVRGHGGAILVASASGQGSCFTVLFPRSHAPLAELPAPAIRGVPGRRSETLLVVDDEEQVREMAKRALERHGYSVLLASTGLAAIDVLKGHPGEIGLVVLDLSMPGMGGVDALPELRRLRSGIKVVVSSGYSESETLKLFEGQPLSGFLQKPYTSRTLAEAVYKALDDGVPVIEREAFAQIN